MLQMSMPIDVGLVVHKAHVKTVKDFLKSRCLLHESMKIKPYLDNTHQHDDFAVIPAKWSEALELESLVDTLKQHVTSALTTIFGADVASLIKDEVVKIVPIDHENRPIARHTQNPLHQAVSKALSESRLSSEKQESDDLLNVLPKSYAIYEPMLLLPSHAFASEPWPTVLSLSLGSKAQQENRFFALISHEMGVTHIAINAPIPARNSIETSCSQSPAVMEENLLRSPSNLQPVYGDFGPALDAFPLHVPTTEDFDQAFWVSTRQNGITQVWAPRYTMFSSGNVTEKARVLRMPSVQTAINEGKYSGRGCSAVDLFAGIGYFAFSYAKAGVTKVVCWDLNPWSVEGFRRGAVANKWSSRIIRTEQSSAKIKDIKDESSGDEEVDGSETFVIFSESNENAGKRLAILRSRIPPIRHVNCGMLPSVGQAWKTAVQALDSVLGGWLHLHETVAENEIQRRAESFQKLIFEYYDELHRNGSRERGARVSIDHIERVKSIGPRLWHIVVDIHVCPIEPQ